MPAAACCVGVWRMSNLDKARAVANEWVDLMGGLDNISYIYGNDIGILVQAIHAAGLLAPDVPEIKHPGFWVDGLEINTVDKDGEVLIEWEDESDYAYYGTQTRNLWLNRDQVLAILAASDYVEKEQDNE